MDEKNVILEIESKKISLPLLSEYSVEQAALKIHHDLLEENLDPIKITSLFKFTEETFKKLKEITDENGKNSLVDLVREKIELNSDDKKSLITENGIKFSLFEAGTSYDYKSCNDFEWNTLDDRISDLSYKKKEREKFLKGIKDSIILSEINLETGELEAREVYAPIKTSTSSFKSEFLKGKS